ncbi:signal peptide containing protein [Theileria equi strain WA]|uniref:Signal peptide containing protein n=1 Tax=Theileria equi strain WA TaxID=1537102 RepID=L1L9M0_THEEQ|nr:signal peptide containing protein [Theileria equi strain WA]EKX72117.1 signal peptide containing protein [Theileria equi strain WA]|eukprot:XP_004831569.1 signal peptide containing protein [Theileria equi strain WA]
MRISELLWALWLVGVCYCNNESETNPLLFDAGMTRDDCLSVLNLKAKADAKVSNLTYDGEHVWSGVGIIYNSLCSFVTIYFDDDLPLLIVIKIKGFFGRDSTVYKHYDGKKWQNGNENDHNSRLTVLKEKCESNSESENPICLECSSSHPTNEASREECKFTPKRDPNVLDISNPDNSEVRFKAGNKNGVKCESYCPKEGHCISSVMDGRIALWIGLEGERCEFVTLLSKGDLTLLALDIKDGGDTDTRYFEKNYDEWDDLPGNKFHSILCMMMGMSGQSFQSYKHSNRSHVFITCAVFILTSVTEIDLEKTVALFQYYDEDTKCAIVSDQNFEDKSIPMSLIGCSQDHLVAGDELNLHCHEDAIVKITLPTSVLSRIKKK